MKNDTDLTIEDAMHETAFGLYQHGLIDKKKMAEMDILCGKKLPEYDGERIKSIRHKLNLSQTVLAAVLNMSPSTVRQWEQGAKHPSGAATRLLFLLESKGIEALF